MEAGADTHIDFDLLCRYCHHNNHAPHYICDCRSDSWLSSYRTLYIDISTTNLKKQAIQSYRNYSLSHSRGILQYLLLPNKDHIEDILPSVGLSSLYHLDTMSRRYGANIFLKDEGENPSGCFKDRETTMCLLNSRNRNMEKAVIYSSGNAAASAAHFSEKTGRRLIAFVPGDTYPEKIDYIRRRGTDVVIIGNEDTNFEQGYDLFSDLNREKIFARHGFDNWSVCNPFRVEGDKTIALEIVKQLSEQHDTVKVPDFVLVPTANGSCLAGIWKGFKELYEIGIINQLPKMVSVGITHANPTAKSVRLQETGKPVQCNITQTSNTVNNVGSTIVAERGYDSMEAASAVLESSGLALELRTSDIQSALLNLLKLEQIQVLEHNILPEPAGLISLAGVDEMLQKNKITPSDTAVCIATGGALKAQESLHSFLHDYPLLQRRANQIIAAKKALHNMNGSERGKKINSEARLDSLEHSFLELENQNY